MYPVSEVFLSAVQENTRRYYWTGKITTKAGVVHEFSEKEIVKGSGYISAQCCDSNEMELGTVYSSEMGITLFLDVDRYTLEDAKVELFYHLELGDGSWEEVPMGIFEVSEANRKIKCLDIKAYDYMLRFDETFNGFEMVGNAYDFMELCSKACHVELAQTREEEEIEAILNQSKIDASVFEIFSEITELPEYHEMIANVLGNQPSMELLESEMKSLRKQLRSYETQKRKLGEELDALDILDDDYDKNYDRIQSEIDEIYDRMDDAESSISKVKKKLSAVKSGIRSVEKVKELVEHMRLLFPKMTCDEQREMYRLFIERIDVYPEEQDNGRMIKSITFKFPIYYEDYETVPTRTPDDQIGFVLDCESLGLTVAEAKATYVEIKAYILEKFGVKVSNLYIAQIKKKYGLDMGVNYNLSKKENARVPTCPKEKEAYIIDALKHFRMLDMSVEMEA